MIDHLAVFSLQVRNTRHFFIVNPTATPYTFMWMCEDEVDPKKPTVFKCLTTQGQVASGKKTQVCTIGILNVSS